MPGGAFGPYEEFPTDEESVVVAEVFPVVNEFVTFTCLFKGRLHSYDLQVEDIDTARELARLLARHKGQTLAGFGEFPLDY